MQHTLSNYEANGRYPSEYWQTVMRVNRVALSLKIAHTTCICSLEDEPVLIVMAYAYLVRAEGVLSGHLHYHRRIDPPLHPNPNP